MNEIVVKSPDNLHKVILKNNGEMDSLDKDILKLLFIDKFRLEDICYKLNLSESTLRRKRHYALKRFSIQLFGIKAL